MFSHTETFILFCLASSQGVFITKLLMQDNKSSILLLLLGFTLGFILGIAELTIFNYLRKK